MWLYCLFSFSLAPWGASRCSISLSNLVLSVFLTVAVVLSRRDFSLHFSDDWYWASFSCFLAFMYFLYEDVCLIFECLFKSFCPSPPKCAVCLSYKNSLYILCTSPLTDMFYKYFLPVCGLHFVFLTISLEGTSFKFWWDLFYFIVKYFFSYS